MGKTESELWFWCFGWFVTVAAIAGNALLIYLITTKHHLHKKANWFILSLATADLLVGFSYIPPLHACRKWFSCSEETWFVRQTIKWLFLYASVSNLFILTVDRYIALTSPLKHKRCMTPTCIAVLIFTAWVVPIITRVCIFTPVYMNNKTTALKYLIPIFLVIFEFIPCILLPCFTFRMVYIARKSQQPRRSSRTSRIIEDSSATELISRSPIMMRVHFREERRGPNHNISVVVCVVAVFILCYSLNVYTSVCNVFGLCSISWKLWDARHLLLVTNSALNPLAYALFKRDIKKAILALGGCFQSSNQVTPSTAN